MLIQTIRALGNKYGLNHVNFEKVFRDKAICKKTIPTFCDRINITSYEHKLIQEHKSEFSKLFFEADSFRLLWICRCLYIENKSVLALLNKYIDNICSITRGNLNTYKLNGWDVHVLYVYQLANYNFCNNIIPSAYFWSFDATHIFSKFKSIYTNLSDNAKFVLKIGSFLHDIGVTLGVEDHEAKGVELTDNYYKELGITESLLKSNNVNLSTDEIVEALKAIVGNHQIINQISAEASDKYIYEKIEHIKSTFSYSDKLLKMFNNDFVGIMSILAISDMMAVDDSLLTAEKYSELLEAYDFLSNIIKNNSYHRDASVYGIKRMISLLKDDLKEHASEIILQTSIKNSDILNDFLYNVRFLSYAMAAIKPLQSVEKAIKLLDFCIEIYKLSSIELCDLNLKFNPNIDNTRLSNILENDIDFIIVNKLIRFNIEKEKNAILISC